LEGIILYIFQKYLIKIKLNTGNYIFIDNKVINFELFMDKL